MYVARLRALVMIPILCAMVAAKPGIAGITQPTPFQTLPGGTTVVNVGWDSDAEATSYKLRIMFEGAVFDSRSHLTGTSAALTNTYTPGWYAISVRSVGAEAFPWSAPVSFLVERSMTPANGSLFATNKVPAVFRWTRSKSATSYQVKLSKYDKGTATYKVINKVQIQQPASGIPKWHPPANLPVGKYRWSVLDYIGNDAGFMTLVYFTVSKKGPPTDTYMVIDLSGGTGAASYPVTYLNGIPAGGWTDTYKSEKMVLRKVNAGTNTCGSPAGELGRDAVNEESHQVTLTNAFFIGIFEVTQRQWELVMGNRPGGYTANYECRPVEKVSYEDIRGTVVGTNWPASDAVDAGSFMGEMRAKTLAAFDLPTEGQWEYACRAGTTTALNSGLNLTATTNCPSLDVLGQYARGVTTGISGTAKVGSFLPNAWELYDMHGNTWEWCLDNYQLFTADPLVNPRGAPGNLLRVLKGGSWADDAQYCRSASRLFIGSSFLSNECGFRAVITLP